MHEPEPWVLDEVAKHLDSAMKILSRPAPQPFTDSVRDAEQNLCPLGREFVGDREPRRHGFTIQLRSFDAAQEGAPVCTRRGAPSWVHSGHVSAERPAVA